MSLFGSTPSWGAGAREARWRKGSAQEPRLSLPLRYAILRCDALRVEELQ